METLKREKLKHSLFQKLLLINEQAEILEYCFEYIKNNRIIDTDVLFKNMSRYYKKQIVLSFEYDNYPKQIEEIEYELFKMLDDIANCFINYEKSLLDN